MGSKFPQKILKNLLGRQNFLGIYLQGVENLNKGETVFFEISDFSKKRILSTFHFMKIDYTSNNQSFLNKSFKSK